VAENLSVPAGTAWIAVDATSGVTGFGVYSREDTQQMAAYPAPPAGSTEGIFPKLDIQGWTVISLLNPGQADALVTLTAVDDAGAVIATESLTVAAGSQTRSLARHLFSQNIRSATYLRYSSTVDLIGLQLSGSLDNTMLDALISADPAGG